MMSLNVIGQAATTLNQLQHQIDTIGHNLANSQTPGYKNKQTEFSSLLFQQINHLTAPNDTAGRLTPEGIRVGSGARLGGSHADFSLGAVKETDRSLDTALLNENYLYQIQVIENGNQEIRYTRDGSFYLQRVNNNEEVILVTSDGHPVLGENGIIQFAAHFDALEILADGQILAKRGTDTETVGNLAIVEAIRPTLLEATGDNLFRLPNLDNLGFDLAEIIQAPNETGQLLQSGALEQANVDYSKELTDLLTAQRSYQLNARSLSMGDQMQGLINQLR